MTNTNYPSATTTPQPQPQKNKGSKNIIIGVLAAGLLGTWGFLLYDKNKSGEKITAQQTQITTLDSAKTAVQQEFDNALARLDSVTGSNNNLQGQLSDRQKEIDAKKAEIRKILNDKSATQKQLASARAMVADLNDKISGLEAEVARLTGENQELTAANTTLKDEKNSAGAKPGNYYI
jgi:chromosome segregation ATPase